MPGVSRLGQIWCRGIDSRATEQVHHDFLVAAGAEPLTLTFTIPDEAIITDPATFLTTLVSLEETFIAAYLAAAQRFAILGETELAQIALRIGAVEDGVLTGTPNDVAFEKALFATVAEASDQLTSLGFIGGAGTVIDCPGLGVIDTTGLMQLEP